MNERKLKVAFYINSIAHGGAERVIVNLAGQFAQKGHDVILITTYRKEKEYDINDQIKRIIIEELYPLPRNKILKNVNLIRTLRNLCKEHNVDTIISFAGEANIRSIIAVVMLKTKCIVSVRNVPKFEYPGLVGCCVRKILFRFADGCVFQTDDESRCFPKVVQNKATIIENPIGDSFFKVEWKGITDSITAVGRLTEQKNYSLLINAFSQITKKFPEKKLFIYGEGPQEGVLKDMVQALSLEDKVVFAGISNDIPDVLANSGLYVLASNFEGMPNSLMEALAVGVPSISTDCPAGGPKHLIKDHENGILIPVNDLEALINAMATLLDNAHLLMKVSNNAREKARLYSNESIYRRWQDYVEYILPD